MEEMKELPDLDQASRIDELESQLEKSKAEAANNMNAANILTGMIDRGEAVVDEDGDISVIIPNSQSSAGDPNVIH